MPKNSFSGKKLRAKRALDLIICLMLLPLALPLGLLLYLLIFLSGGGSPIYTQERIGRRGRRFRIYKFRTMVRDADRLLEQCLRDDPSLAAEWREMQKLKNDPRITRLGRIIRKSGLDELPQLANILAGDMSLVGPRPIVQSEISRYGRHYADYCQVRPGLTGLWQISGRNNTSYLKRVACDHYYVTNWSLCLDFKILVQTIPVLIRRSGAY